MNRIVNNPDFVVEDMLKGFVKTHKDIVSTTEDARVIHDLIQFGTRFDRYRHTCFFVTAFIKTGIWN